MSTKNNTKNNSYIIYLIGKPGTGKYTIAQELAKFGFIVCDNQLINNPIFTLLNYDGFSKIPEIGWNAIGHIRTAVFDFIAIEQKHNYVLTNSPYAIPALNFHFSSSKNAIRFAFISN